MKHGGYAFRSQKKGAATAPFSLEILDMRAWESEFKKILKKSIVCVKIKMLT